MIKHIDVQYHFFRDMVKDGRVKLVKVETLMNDADSLTKLVSIEKFRWCSESMGLLAPKNKIMVLILPFLLQGVRQVGEC